MAEPEEGPRAHPLLVDAVDSILRHNDEARAAYEALRERGFSEEESSEEIARVLLGVMYHVGAESEAFRAAGSGSALRAECFRRIRTGERAADIFGA